MCRHTERGKLAAALVEDPRVRQRPPRALQLDHAAAASAHQHRWLLMGGAQPHVEADAVRLQRREAKRVTLCGATCTQRMPVQNVRTNNAKAA
eukprot:5888919-Prymnesium_polylepis.1